MCLYTEHLHLCKYQHPGPSLAKVVQRPDFGRDQSGESIALRHVIIARSQSEKALPNESYAA